MRSPRRLPLLFLIAGACWPRLASAQSVAGHLLLNQYQPTPFSDRVLRLDGPAVLPFGQFRIGVDTDYAHRPLVLIDSASGAAHNVVEHALGASLLASFGLGRRLEAGLALPFTAFQAGDGPAGAVAPSAAGVGNLRVGLKAHLLAWRSGAAGASLTMTVPTGTGTLVHDPGLGGEGRLFASYHRGGLTLGARAGLMLRAHDQFYDVSVGNELTAAAGATFQLRPRTAALAELAGLTAAAQPFADARQSPLEMLLGARQRFGKSWVTLAAGPGLLNGYGSPLFRVVAGVTWSNRSPDSDLDGIPDDTDRCPLDAEDRDGFEDSDGCPDPDNDKDGVPDATDKCPLAPEDRDGFEDSDGCPDPDNDKDGLLDAVDKCPDAAETVNDFEDEDGCPDDVPPASDKDKDGIPDESDECPEEAEDKDGFEDEDGCPDPDNDKDGIPDTADKCPLQPETINGVEDDDGCPDKGQSQVRLGKNEIETLQPIYFDTDRSRVRHAFYNVLGQIALLLKAHPEIGRCAVEGHTDDTGPTEWNDKLSSLRAVSVIDFLTNRGGVDPKRLVPISHGAKLPWASNETPEGRAKNRRVVFHIEGVNPEEQKKQEQRQERRRRIRHRKEAEESAPAKTPTSPGTPAKPPSAASAVSPPDESKKPNPDVKVKSPALTSPPAGVPPGAKSPGAASSTTGPFYGPELPPGKSSRTRTSPATSTRVPAPAPARLPSVKAPEAAPAEAASEEKPEPTKPATRVPSRPAPRPTRRTAPDKDAGGPPPTLQDLLKLPPR